MLFHHFLFGKKNIPGLPDMDIIRVIGVMKEVDLGSDERILLTKEDGSVSIVASFAEIAYQLEETYEAILYK